jgi:hypothetical protein
MDRDELQEQLGAILDPEWDEDIEPREWPHPRLEDRHKLDCSFLRTFNWEGSTGHPYTRLCSASDEPIHALTRNNDVAGRLMRAGLYLLADSILAYHDKEERSGQLRYYPSAILTFWSGFETFVRFASELMIATVRNVPNTVALFLRDQEEFLDPKRGLASRTRYQPVTERYAVVLKYGYGFEVDRGATFWQSLTEAKSLRDYYTHLEVTVPRDITGDQVARFMEAVLLAIIVPSATLKRILMRGVFDHYATLAELLPLISPYVEQPFFKDWPFAEGYLFHCNFESVDADRFPNMTELVKRRDASGSS